jgi:hypothetical protein
MMTDRNISKNVLWKVWCAPVSPSLKQAIAGQSKLLQLVAWGGGDGSIGETKALSSPRREPIALETQIFIHV